MEDPKETQTSLLSAFVKGNTLTLLSIHVMQFEDTYAVGKVMLVPGDYALIPGSLEMAQITSE